MKPLRKLAFLCGVASLIALGACKQEAAPTPQESGAQADASEAGQDIAASDGRMVLPIVAGRPAAVYFSVRNDGSNKATLSAVHVAGAGKAEMHKTEGGAMNAVDAVDLAPGETIRFAPGGYHVMVFDPSGTLKAGSATELTLTFSDGEKLTMPLRIEAMGHDMDDMGQMSDGSMDGHDMSGMHH